jgi:hypothetical protein
VLNCQYVELAYGGPYIEYFELITGCLLFCIFELFSLRALIMALAYFVYDE